MEIGDAKCKIPQRSVATKEDSRFANKNIPRFAQLSRKISFLPTFFPMYTENNLKKNQ